MDLFKKNLIIFFTFFLMSQYIYSKKIIQNAHVQLRDQINKIHWFRFISLSNIMLQHPEIEYQRCDKGMDFNFKSFPLSIDHNRQPYQGFLLPTFIVTIPQGIVQGMNGLVLVDNQCIEEMIWRGCPSFYLVAKKIDSNMIQKVKGKVAVITQPAYDNYFHWHTEILSRLAFLEIQGVEYDYLYVPQKSKFMKETLKMWGIDESKIIAPTSEDFAIQADEIILPSLVCNSNHGWTHFVNYVRPELLEYVKNKLFKAAQEKNINSSLFAKKVFISRKDAPFRKVINEDEVFEKLKVYGFQRYELSQLSVAEQIMLFNQADIIVSVQGTGLANCIYCNQKTKIIELFQSLGDCTFWYISQIFNLDYTPVQTVRFEVDFIKAWRADTYMPLGVIDNIKMYLQNKRDENE